jgi:hypothetical protein
MYICKVVIITSKRTTMRIVICTYTVRNRVCTCELSEDEMLSLASDNVTLDAAILDVLTIAGCFQTKNSLVHFSIKTVPSYEQAMELLRGGSQEMGPSLSYTEFLECLSGNTSDITKQKMDNIRSKLEL